MATTSYTIYSHYDPAQRERLERETGQIPADPQDIAEEWEREATLTFKRKLAPPPRFVPATGDPIPSAPIPSSSARDSDVAGWYRSLTKTDARPRRSSPSEFESVTVAGSSTHPVSRPLEKPDEKNWFIMKAITSEPPPAAVALPTLADILARDPPPLPHEAQYKHPVWLAIGPANKGFAMLQNSGWSEGEPLGPEFARRPPMHRDATPEDMIRTNSETKLRPLIKEEAIDMLIQMQNGAAEREIIDLTMSDSESSEESDAGEDDTPAATNARAEGSRTALITPIATVLKSDRLGIGLKAKTVGPHRASQKRITHNAAATVAHIKAAEELRQQKKQNGRGHRGFARRRKLEEANRKALLAYMNQG
ncbi:hypothetical protein B0H17DRAFT_1164930 [Mycena rosella]|uniref:G-patch domain-containing protein n=1 Tax=Mycena rosella TaxID=1033263 RepID=A0AAD7B5J5_MYCRO|nr:hypothetical protein B0H17DRAFT_1164930 [Mycena rosella]